MPGAAVANTGLNPSAAVAKSCAMEAAALAAAVVVGTDPLPRDFPVVI